MNISIIAAFDENRVIGSAAGIPWHLPRDVQHFRDYCAGKAMLLGRRTFEEMDGWFSDQFPIVVTRQSGFRADPGGVDGYGIVPSVEAGISQARSTGEPELVVAGGAQIYALALPFATELLITEVHGSFEGDTFFPEISSAIWNEVARERFEADTENSHPMSFVRYERRPSE